jgi:N-acetyl-gamma-glutamyl-phosphate reductase
MLKMASVSIVGASGYTGQETLDRVLAHPELELYAVGSDSLAGREAVALDPRLNRNGGRRVPHFITNEAALACEADVTLLCLPHEDAAALAPPAKGVVVDLSGAHRLLDATQYEQWYGFTHPRSGELVAWRYGLPEIVPPEGRLIANPG